MSLKPSISMSKVQPVSAEDGGVPEGPYSPYPFNLNQLNDLNSNKDGEGLAKAGGVAGLAKALGSDPHNGLDPAATGDNSIAAHAAAFGENKFPDRPPKSFFGLVWENLQDPIVMLLCAAATLSTTLGAAIPDERAHNGWIEGVAIWVAVILVTCVGAGNDYNKDLQFRKLNKQKDAIMIKVVRGGEQTLISNHDIVVGDLIVLDTGDKVVADGLVVNSFGLVIDEASLTGESDPIKKDNEHDPWVRSGTQVSEGSGHILVTAVGVNSEWGKTMMLVGEAGDEQTPLQEKLEDVAAAVGKVGLGVAIACFIALIIKWCVANKGFPIKKINDNGPVQFFLYAITIIVVAVPEGLPLAVTISLAYSMKKMMKDNNFVRVLAACETMGGATAICSDKTGTLTENRMTVVEGWFSGVSIDHPPQPSELRPDVLDLLEMNCALNSKAFLVEAEGKPTEFVGNRTECALLMLLKHWGKDYRTMRDEYEPRIVKLFGFTSARKMASVLVQMPDRYRLFNKGAAEWVLKKCTKYFDANGNQSDMDDAKRNELLEVVTAMAKRGLRCICLTYSDYPLEDASRAPDFFEDATNMDCNLVACGIVGIKDPVRKEVPDAVATCQRAGIVVRMVTGDNIHTARHISRECGILVEGAEAMEGPDFRVCPANDLIPKLPMLRVLARSSPEDKLTLVNMLKKQGDVVAVTGDGTNDAPALKESDVGLAMGIAGTEVAKEAADIVILDDNFSSIVKSVLWGRSVFNNIRKFLQFQLTVNAVALVISFIGAIVGGHEPLNVLQLLWVNLIMDTMGALALATEDPTPELLEQKPHGRDEPLISKKMWKHICIQGLYQLFWLLLLLYGLPEVINKYKIVDQEDYYADKCVDKVKEHLAGVSAGYDVPSSVEAWDSAGAGWYCTLMQQCGWPLGVGRTNGACIPLNNYYFVPGNATAAPRWEIPSDAYRAICAPYYGAAGYDINIASGANKINCTVYDKFKSAQRHMEKQFKEAEEEDWKQPLSVLFNAFIMMQVANEINARRINDEYTIFEGIFTSPIFLSVIFITMGLQAIIINFLGLFFKVDRLDWKEWLATIAIGMGAWPISLITRFVSRAIASAAEKNQQKQHTLPVSGSLRASAKGGSFRSGSGRGHLRAAIISRD